MKKTFKDHAGEGFGNFDFLECAITSTNWDMLDRSLRNDDVSISFEARILLANMLMRKNVRKILSRLPKPLGRRPDPAATLSRQQETLQKWQTSNDLMRKVKEKIKDNDVAAKIVKAQLQKLGYTATEKQIVTALEKSWQNPR